MPTLTDHQRAFRGYLAEFLSPHRRDLLPRIVLNRTRYLTVVIEDVYQTHNASACLRSCDCFGIQDVHIIENRNEFQTSRGVELGASQWLTLHRYTSGDVMTGPADNHTHASTTAETPPQRPDAHTHTHRCLRQLKEQGYAVVMTSPHHADGNLEDFDITQPAALVFGNEKDGCSDMVRDMADHVLRIPIHGFTESFNISVAVAVCLHHLVWKLRQSGISWGLPRDQQDLLLDQWVRIASARRLTALQTRFNELAETDDFAARLPELARWPDWDAVPRDAPEERRSRTCRSE